jgi:hypothetical protein
MTITDDGETAGTRVRIPAEVRARAADADGVRRTGGSVKRSTHRWSRWLHVYTSMFALLIVLFFGATGITLNHPQWTFGDDVDTSTVTGSLPFDSTLSDGSVDYLSISEYVRSEHGVHGDVDSFQTTNGEASIAYKSAGYAADVFVDVGTGSFELTVEQQGWVAVLNDLHKGRDTDSSWNWTIDIAGGLLVAIALTGLVMQCFLRKRRRSALIAVGTGALVMVVLAAATLR